MELLNDQTFLQSLANKAQADAQFKRSLVENPVAVIEKFLGKRIILPQNKKVIVVDQMDTSAIYINLPAVSDTDDIELNEEQLEIVAGGAGHEWIKP